MEVPSPMTREHAMRIMLTQIGAFATTASVDDLRWLRVELEAFASSGVFADRQACASLVTALADLVFVEAQMRSDEVNAELRQLIDDHHPDT